MSLQTFLGEHLRFDWPQKGLVFLSAISPEGAYSWHHGRQSWSWVEQCVDEEGQLGD